MSESTDELSVRTYVQARMRAISRAGGLARQLQWLSSMMRRRPELRQRVERSLAVRRMAEKVSRQPCDENGIRREFLWVRAELVHRGSAEERRSAA